MKIQAGEIVRENRELFEVLILSLVKRKNNHYEVTEKGLEFHNKPTIEA